MIIKNYNVGSFNYTNYKCNHCHKIYKENNIPKFCECEIDGVKCITLAFIIFTIICFMTGCITITL